MSVKIWTVREIIQWSSTYLKQSGSETPRLDAELLLCSALGCKRLDLYLDHDKPLNQQERDIYRGFIKRRSLHEPVAYILGEKEFYGLSFKVNKDVLIPRPETELLIDLILEDFGKDRVAKGLDVGTGSGCIAITLKKQRPLMELDALDICDNSLALARENASSNGVSVNFNHLDIFAAMLGDSLGVKFDFIVSNPPYISLNEKDQIRPSVLNYEPHKALFAAEEGLEFYKLFATVGRKYLIPCGKIFLEIGHLQASAIIKLLGDHGWAEISVHKDLNGSDRVVVATAP